MARDDLKRGRAKTPIRRPNGSGSGAGIAVYPPDKTKHMQPPPPLPPPQPTGMPKRTPPVLVGGGGGGGSGRATNTKNSVTRGPIDVDLGDVQITQVSSNAVKNHLVDDPTNISDFKLSYKFTRRIDTIPNRAPAKQPDVPLPPSAVSVQRIDSLKPLQPIYSLESNKRGGHQYELGYITAVEAPIVFVILEGDVNGQDSKNPLLLLRHRHFIPSHFAVPNKKVRHRKTTPAPRPLPITDRADCV